LFSTRRIAILEGDRSAAEILHTFFHLMELEAFLVTPDETAVPTLRRLAPDVIALDLDLPDLRALDLSRAIRVALPRVPIILMTEHASQMDVGSATVIAKPHARFEELLRMFELILALER
jgi:DNA-binding response OmpR family regulator